MSRRSITAVIASTLALALPAVAIAKGASEARIQGPGLDQPLVLRGGEQSTLSALAQDAGFFQAVFGQEPDPMLAKRPAGDLGPRYEVTYRMPGPARESEIRQALYPYAKPTPLTHTAPGQPFFGADRTRGGWFAAPETLKDTLVAAGLPATRPGSSNGGPRLGLSTPELVALAAAGALGLAGAVLLARRRTRPVPAGRLA